MHIWFSSKFDFRKLSTSADGNILDRFFFFVSKSDYVEKFGSLLKRKIPTKIYPVILGNIF